MQLNIGINPVSDGKVIRLRIHGGNGRRKELTKGRKEDGRRY